MMYGVDISRWQKGIDISKVKNEGFEFAILKIGGSDAGRYKDGQFETFYSKCKELKIPVGAYYFGKDLTEAEAKESAKHCLQLLQNHQFEMPIFYDVEGEMINVGKINLTKIIQKFCSIIENAGYYVGIYSSQSFFNNNMDDNCLKKYAHWVACWGRNKPILKSGAETLIWQYSGEYNLIRSNKVAGMTVDQDICYVDFTTAIKKLGLNNFPKPTSDIESHYPDIPKIYSLNEIKFEGVGSIEKNRGYFDDYNIAKQMAREIYKEDSAGVVKVEVAIMWRPVNRIDEGGIAFNIANDIENEYPV